ncbi:MAG: hypothetical protein ACI9LO_000203 [Planctomycetota bacterium]|jgi:uncharacterized protein YcfJ
MKSKATMLAIIVLVFANGAIAGSKKHQYNESPRSFEYAKVLDVRPLYREVRVSSPVRECWDEPVHQVRHQSSSAGGMVAGGLIGGIIGHQFGKGRGQKIATAMGTLIGAQLGHDSVTRENRRSQTSSVEYQETCKNSHKVRYEEVVDGYDVTYQFRGQRYQIEMPYHPGKRIKMRVQFSPEI